jgi:sulfite exporter TauE/SafE/copper chaperone CopZ
MKSGVKTKKLRIGGMTCVNCQNKIERNLRAAGVENAEASYVAGTVVVTYDDDIISIESIAAIIEKLGYQTGNGLQESNPRRVIGTLVVTVLLYAFLQGAGILNLLAPSGLADAGMGYGTLFVVGLVTSIHCVAMCGGVALSQSIPKNKPNDERENTRLFSAFAPAFLYNAGRAASYTVVGFVLGFVGLLFGGGSSAGLPTALQGILKIIAGAFMVVMGINMLELFPRLRKFQPRLPKSFTRKIGAGGARKLKNGRPLVAGLLNGLMPCGPLQAMQITALASGNPFVGGMSMLMFSLGTVPLMLGFGSVVSALGVKFERKATRVGAILVVALGLAMLSQGGILSGFLPPALLTTLVFSLCAAGVVSSLNFSKPEYKIILTIAAVAAIIAVPALWNQRKSLFGGRAGASPYISGENRTKTQPETQTMEIVDGKQIINSVLSSGRYPDIAVEAGTPVKWIIDAPQGSVNGCNGRMLIREYGIEYSFKTGENVVEFTPEKAGTIWYSCWMGMIRGSVTVTESASPQGGKS